MVAGAVRHQLSAEFENQHQWWEAAEFLGMSVGMLDRVSGPIEIIGGGRSPSRTRLHSQIPC